MKTLITTLLGCLLYFNTIAQNAATSVWTDAFGLQDTVLKIPTIIDNLGNLYVAGSTINGSSGPDIVIKKYDSNGDPVFGLTYSSAGNNRDQATTIAIDNNYNLIVGGFSYVNATNSYDFLVLKYDSAGTLLWTYTYNGTGSAADLVSAMALDGSNIYITGASVGISSLFDFTTIKLNSAGSVQWNNRYNYLGSDLPFDIDIIDTNIYVNGGSQSTMTNWDYALLHYSINGTPIDTIRTTGTGVGFDRATQAVTDNQGYIYITGTYATTSNGLDYKTIKFDQQGNVKWIATFDNTAHQDDIANAIAVDFDGNVYITGKTFNSLGNYDYCTIKYDSLGTTQWTRFYDNKYYDEATSITVDSYNNVYVTGSSNNTANKDFTTIGYGTAGDTLWTKRFNGAYNGNDEATSIIEENGFVYVSGQTQINSTQYKNVTIAYGQAKIKEIPDLLGEEKSSNLFYLPNDGQLANDTGSVATNVLFYVPNHYPSLFVTNNGLSYVFNKFKNDTLSNDTVHRIDMQFLKGNSIVKTIVYPNKNTSPFFSNYYLPHCPNGVIEVQGSTMLKAEKLYEGIDLYYSSNQKGEKHYWVIAPNANPKAIKIKFNGASSVSHPVGKYSIHSSIGTIEYDSLVAYEIDAVGNVIIGTSQPLQFLHDTANNTYSFKTFTYNTGNTLVIMAKQKINQSQQSASVDNLLWSSFIGGSNSTNLNAVKNDIDGNVYFTGNTTGENFPVTTGISVPPLSGYKDAILIKLNSSVEPVWISYLGGTIDATNDSDDDNAIALVVSKTGDRVYIAGTTTSEDMPIEDGGGNFFSDPSNTNCSDYYDCTDAFFARFDVNGLLEWSTYFGSNGPEAIFSLALDGDNNLFAVGLRNSNTTLLNNGNFNSGNGLFIKFDANNDLLWSKAWKSRLIHGVAVDSDNNYYFTGWTRSNDMEVQNFDPNFDGGSTENYSNFDDAFVVKFNANDALAYSFYYGGSCNDRAHSIALDNDNNVYVGGTTIFEGPDPIFACPASADLAVLNGLSYTSNSNNNPLADVFLLKIAAHTSGDASILNAGYYGGGAEETSYSYTSTIAEDITSTLNDLSIAVKGDGTLFITGTSRSTNTSNTLSPTIQMPSSQPQAFYVNTDLNLNSGPGLPQTDAFIAAFNANFDLLWSTYYGGKNAESPTGISLSNSDNRLYLSGATLSTFSTNDFEFQEFDNVSSTDHFQDNNLMVQNSSPSWGAMFDITNININSLKSQFANSSLKIFPNPTRNVIYISSDSSIEKIEIFDLCGKSLVNKNNLSEKVVTIDLNELKSGYYLISVQDLNNNSRTYKLIKN
jgi:hypothetical protein